MPTKLQLLERELADAYARIAELEAQIEANAPIVPLPPELELIEALACTPSERKILRFLFQAKGRFVRNSTLLNYLYSDRPDKMPETDAIIKTYVHHIRRALWSMTKGTWSIESRYNDGYRLIQGPEAHIHVSRSIRTGGSKNTDVVLKWRRRTDFAIAAFEGRLTPPQNASPRKDRS